MFTIDLGDGDEAGKAMLPGLVPCLFKAGGDAGHSADDDQRALHRSQRASHFAREIEVAGHIDEVELLAVDFNRRHGRADRDMALDLFGVIVADRVPIFDTSLTVNHAGGVEHRLHKRRLAFRAVSQYSDVAYVLHHVVLHNLRLLAAAQRPFSSEAACVAPLPSEIHYIRSSEKSKPFLSFFFLRLYGLCIKRQFFLRFPS